MQLSCSCDAALATKSTFLLAAFCSIGYVVLLCQVKIRGIGHRFRGFAASLSSAYSLYKAVVALMTAMLFVLCSLHSFTYFRNMVSNQITTTT